MTTRQQGSTPLGKVSEIPHAGNTVYISKQTEWDGENNSSFSKATLKNNLSLRRTVGLRLKYTKKKRAWKEKFSSVKTLIIIHLEETNGKSYLFVAGFYFTRKHNKPFLLPFHLSKFHILKSWHLVIKLKGNLTSHQCIVWMEIEWAATLGSRWLLFNPLHLRFHAARLWESCAQNHLVY